MDLLTISDNCVFCGVEKIILVPKEGYLKWQNGTLIQKALPTLTADEREFLISKICGECFDKTFGENGF